MRVFAAALCLVLALAVPARAQDASALMACPPRTDGTLEYAARYLKADWVKSDIPGKPDLAIALLARIVNRSGAPVEIANPVKAFNNSVRIRYPDGTAATSTLAIFPAAPDAPDTVTLMPHEPFVFGQGGVAKWAELHKKQKVEKDVLVIAEIKVSEEDAGEDQWSGCIESRIGDIVYPKEETSERDHADQTVTELGKALREENNLPKR